jgi:hypothetical protein
MLINEENRTAIIALYLQGDLEGEALDQFKLKMAWDEKFRSEVELQHAIIRNMSAVGRKELKLQLKQYHREIISETSEYIAEEQPLMMVEEDHRLYEGTRIIGGKKMRWLMAASLVGLLTIAGLRYYASFSSASIFKEKFTPYVLHTIRGPLFSQEITALYRAGDYDIYLSGYKMKPLRSLEEVFLAGNVYLINAQSVKAIESFRQVMEQNEKLTWENQRYYEEAEYFLALAYLQNNDPDKAEPLFQKIAASPKHPYHREVGNGLLWKIKVVKFKG